MKRNKLRTIFKLNQAVEVKALLLGVAQRESQLIKNGESDNYDALEIVTKQTANLSIDIKKGLQYIKDNGEETPLTEPA